MSKIIDAMLQAGATADEAAAAAEFFRVLRPGLKTKRNGRIDTTHGDKTPLGLYRTCRGLCNADGQPHAKGGYRP
jgi:hypothetical protein